MGSAAVAASDALLAMTVSAFTGENGGQALALGGSAVAIGTPLYAKGVSTVSKKVASSLPGVGVAVSGGILAYDTLEALKKAGCFE